MNKTVKVFEYDDKDRYSLTSMRDVSISDICYMTQTLAKQAKQQLKKREDCNHAIYAVYNYKKSKLEFVNIYCPCKCLNDEEFYNITNFWYKVTPECMIYAVHRKVGE